MKKIYLFLVTLAFSLSVYSQNSSVIDTVYGDKWKNNNWSSQSRSFNSYDAQCRNTETNIQVLDSTNGTTWLNSSRIMNTYLPNNSVSKTVTQLWDPATNAFTTVAELTFEYNSSNKLDSSTLKACVATVCTNAVTHYGYNAQELLDSTKTVTTSQGFTLTTISKYTYDNSGRTIEINTTNINSLSNTGTTSRTQYSYDNAGNLTRTVSQQFQDPAWINQNLDSFIYNSGNKQIESLSKGWDPLSSSWVNTTHTLTSYNAAGQPDQIVLQNWDSQASNWVNEDRQSYIYKSCRTLPLTLLKFSAVREKNLARLSWRTTSEVNFSHFIVERSGANSNFESIGKVFPIIGNTSVKDYYYEDDLSKLNDGNVYYRIKMVDVDGAFTYTNIEHINFENTPGFTLYPNPVRNSLRIKGIGTFSVQLYNSTGSLNLSKVITGGNGNIDVSPFASGLYWLKIKDQKGSIQVKKVILK